MLSKAQLLQVLVETAAVNDAHILFEDRNLPEEMCRPEDRETVRRITTILDGLLKRFDYRKSCEFKRGVDGKSAAYAEMMARFAQDPVKRSDHLRRFETLLSEVIGNPAVFDLVDEEQEADLRSLLELASRLGNPA